jgi:hypothetical protein
MTVTRTTTPHFPLLASGVLDPHSPPVHVYDDNGTAKGGTAEQERLEDGRTWLTKAQFAAQAPALGTQTRPNYGSLVPHGAGK